MMKIHSANWLKSIRQYFDKWPFWQKIITAFLLIILLAFGVISFIQWRVATTVVLTTLLILGMLITIIYAAYKASWTGFGEYPGQPANKDRDYQRYKTFWDWLKLLIIPLVLAAAAIWFNQQQYATGLQVSKDQYGYTVSVAATRYANDLNIATTRYANDQQLALDQQQETALQNYLDRMSDLLLKTDVHNANQAGDDIRILARARTLTILRRLNPERKAVVLKFLYYGGLIKRTDPFPIVNLNGADMSQAELFGFKLDAADLANVNFSNADLREAILDSAYLSQASFLSNASSKNKTDLSNASICFAQLTEGANLSAALLVGAILVGSDLIGANLSGANLDGADLSGANLSGANLQNASLRNVKQGNDTTICKTKQSATKLDPLNLSGADLSNATLTGADLGNANLSNANMTGAILTGVVWSNTTCPDTTKSDDDGGTCEGHLAH